MGDGYTLRYTLMTQQRDQIEHIDDFETQEEWNAEKIKSLTQKGMPSLEYLQNNFKSKSAAIRYLSTQHNCDVKSIAAAIGLPYRHVYNVVAKMKKAIIPEHICPVCMNRKG